MALMKVLDENANGVCGKCKYHAAERRKNALWRFDTVTWYCTNERSANCGYQTVYTDSCEDFEEREK